MVPTTEAVIEKDLAEATKTREGLLAKRAELDQQIREAEARFSRLKLAQAALEGKLDGAAPTERKPRAPSTRAPRGARGEQSTKIVQLLEQHPSGLVSRQIADALPDVKGLANLLTKLKSEGMINQDARRGPYTLAPARREPQPEAP